MLDSQQRGQGAKWLCVCDCGEERLVPPRALRSGNTKSCGCLKRERFYRHGKSRTKEYQVWADMWARCTNPNAARYPRYGARDITVCEQWRDFVAFLADMGERPSDSHTIDRIDNDGNYEPSNCRWVEKSRQGHTRSTSKLSLEKARDIRERVSQGVRQRVLAEEYGVDPSIISLVTSGKIWREHAE